MGCSKPGRYGTGWKHHGVERENLDGIFHGIARDGIEIPRNFTGRDFTGRKKHGTPRDGIEISRKFTGEKSAELHGTGCKNDFAPYLYGTPQGQCSV